MVKTWTDLKVAATALEEIGNLSRFAERPAKWARVQLIRLQVFEAIRNATVKELLSSAKTL